MNIIVTGANGQLGSEIKELAKTFTSWNFFYTDIDNLDLSVFSDVEEFFIKCKPDYVINCSAYTRVDNAETDKENAYLVNASVPGKLSELAKKLKYKLIHISTDYVFSGESYLPINEDAKTEPASEYGKTKLEGEKLVSQNSDAIIIRTSWLYSKFGNNFVKSMLKLGAEREQLNVVFDQIGSPTNASDLAATILTIISYTEKNKNWHFGVYHYANEGVASWYDFAIEIMSLGNRTCKVYPIETIEYPLPAPRPAYSLMNKNKIKKTFEIEIPYWKDSLKKTIDFLK